jgi:hypothetical protein
MNREGKRTTSLAAFYKASLFCRTFFKIGMFYISTSPRKPLDICINGALEM